MRIPARTVIFSVCMVVCCTSLAMGQTIKFTSHLSGTNEVPPVQTSATGQATFQLGEDGKTLKYELSVSDIADVTMAHIHVGAPGSNGEHVAALYPVGMAGSMGEKEEGMAGMRDNKAAPQKMSGVIARGTIQAKDLVGPLRARTIADLIAEIRAGKTYVNVHTKTHGDGEIRGPIR